MFAEQEPLQLVPLGVYLKISVVESEKKGSLAVGGIHGLRLWDHGSSSGHSVLASVSGVRPSTQGRVTGILCCHHLSLGASRKAGVELSPSSR